MSAVHGSDHTVRRVFTRGAAALLAVLLGCGGGSPPPKGQRTVLLKTAADARQHLREHSTVAEPETAEA